MSLIRSLQLVIGVIILAAFIWVCGLILFVDQVESLVEPAVTGELQTTDAIVVLTGGSERVSAGIDLLEAAKAKKLFISGVHPGLTLDHLLANHPMPKNLRECCIILGHEAESTVGNAAETQEWMAIEQYNSIRLVTANYHMARSLLLFHTAMPDMQIIPHPVTPDSVKLKNWWQHSGTANLLVNEYNKYLVALLRYKIMDQG